MHSCNFQYLTIFFFLRYARLYLAIQFFDPDSLLPPPFTFLTLIMYLVSKVVKTMEVLINM